MIQLINEISKHFLGGKGKIIIYHEQFLQKLKK